MADKQRLVESKCPCCEEVDRFTISVEGLKKRTKGVPVHLAFPELSKERHVQLSTHVCPKCQGKEKKA